MPICQVHNTEMQLRKGQYGDFWSCGQKLQDGSWCKYKPPKPQTNDQKWDDTLDRAGAMMDNNKKDTLITRLAIAKSIIERGDKWGMETIKESEAVFSWVTGRNQCLLKAFTEPKTDQVPVDQIPF